MKSDLSQNIPHRGPMHWLDLATEQGSGDIVAMRLIYAGHPFISEGKLPRSALLEMVGQAAACGVPDRQSADISPDIFPIAQPRQGVMTGLRDVQFFDTPSIGQTVVIHVRTVKSFGKMFLCQAEVNVANRQILSGSFTFALLD